MKDNTSIVNSDQKTMATSAGTQPGRKVEVSTDIPTNSLEKMLGADSYANFPASTTISFETYSTRRDALVEKLGNKDTVKG